MGKVPIILQMVTSIKVVTRTIKKMVQEFLHGLMVTITKEHSKMDLCLRVN